MSRDEAISGLQQYFSANELLCPHTIARWGQSSWQFLRTEYLCNLLVIRRDILRVPMVCNTASQTQRGTRCNCCPMVRSKTSVYLSAHVLGCAGDFTPKGMTAEEARQKIAANAHLLPYPLRMEAGVTWLHIDTLPQYGITDKVYLFHV